VSGRSARASRLVVTKRSKLSARQARLRRRVQNWGLGVGLVALAVGLGYAAYAAGITRPSTSGSSPNMAMDMGPARPATHGSSQYPYAVGDPGVGAVAPEIKLKSTVGGSFDLASYTGNQPVLLYFQEGLTCQPCWDQIVAIQKQMPAFHALGIDTIVSITNGNYDQLKQKSDDEQLSIPVLADEKGSVSLRYQALRYGMMMGMNPGHTFILVGKDGIIKWRADYGGPPKYTMFLPPDVLLNDLKQGLVAAS
jgi:peroxiredoxin